MQVEITVQSVGTITLDAEHPTKTMDVTVTDTSRLIYQMVAKASMKAGSSTKAEDSKEVSTAVNLPCYMPNYLINSTAAGDQLLAKNVTVTGDTLDNLSIQVELDASSRNAIVTPPVYRAELTGTWTEPDGTKVEAAVLAKADILTVSQGKASATFSNLPEYIGEATDIRVRIWYVESGLGPLYALRQLSEQRGRHEQ